MEGNVFYQIMMLVIALMGIVLFYYGVPWIRNKVGSQKLNLIYTIVQIAVAAAEQTFKKAGMGQSKKQFVINYLKERGISITDQEINALIEAAVYELNRAKNLLFKDLDLQPVVETVEFTD